MVLGHIQPIEWVSGFFSLRLKKPGHPPYIFMPKHTLKAQGQLYMLQAAGTAQSKPPSSII
jgi:hypothetical protein